MKPYTPPASAFIPLDEEERELLEADKNELLTFAPIDPDRKAYFEQVARNTLTMQKQRINLFVFKKDIASFKARARQEGIPYQTLIASVLHKYNEGRLVEK